MNILKEVKMVSRNLLLETAKFYENQASNDNSYKTPRDILQSAISKLEFDGVDDSITPISNPPQFIVLRTSGTTGEPKLLRHSMDFHESVVDSGIEALSRRGLLDKPHTCLIAISRGRLSGGFLFVYEVARRCGWSILLLGASDDADDIARLCDEHEVDVVFMAPNNIAATFTSTMSEHFSSVREVLYIGEMPAASLSSRIHKDFPQLQLHSFIYSSNDTGPIGIPNPDSPDGTYEVPLNVLVEVENDEGQVSLNGSGQYLISVLGLEDPKLIRWRIGDVGTLMTSNDGKQIIGLQGRGELSVKFHLDAIGGSVILFQSVIVEYLNKCGVFVDNNLIVRIHNDDQRTVVDINIVSEKHHDLVDLEKRFNSDFPIAQLRGRLRALQITDEEAKILSPGKRRLFIKSQNMRRV